MRCENLTALIVCVSFAAAPSAAAEGMPGRIFLGKLLVVQAALPHQFPPCPLAKLILGDAAHEISKLAASNVSAETLAALTWQNVNTLDELREHHRSLKAMGVVREGPLAVRVVDRSEDWVPSPDDREQEVFLAARMAAVRSANLETAATRLAPILRWIQRLKVRREDFDLTESGDFRHADRAARGYRIIARAYGASSSL